MELEVYIYKIAKEITSAQIRECITKLVTVENLRLTKGKTINRAKARIIYESEQPAEEFIADLNKHDDIVGLGIEITMHARKKNIPIQQNDEPKAIDVEPVQKPKLNPRRRKNTKEATRTGKKEIKKKNPEKDFVAENKPVVASDENTSSGEVEAITIIGQPLPDIKRGNYWE